MRKLRKRLICKNKTKKVKYWWYNYLSPAVNVSSLYSIPVGSLTVWFKLKTSKWHNITIVKQDDTITTYLDGIKE